MEHINDRPVGRFAPSPTGRMHLGNVFSALLSWLSAKSRGGSWLLRIEDIDTGRSRRDYALQLMDDLQWLGLAWDGEPLWQSQRSHVYEHYFSLLQQQGCIYPCYCTRADLLAAQAPHESDGRVVYPGTCRPRTLAIPSAAERAHAYHDRVAPAMAALRAPIDALELKVEKKFWPMPSYGDILYEV